MANNKKGPLRISREQAAVWGKIVTGLVISGLPEEEDR